MTDPSPIAGLAGANVGTGMVRNPGAARFAVVLPIVLVCFAGCQPYQTGGPDWRLAPIFVGLGAGTVVGIVAASWTIALGFGRPRSAVRRVVHVVVAIGLFLLLPVIGLVIGFFVALAAHPMV